VFLVYGSFQASAAILADNELENMRRKHLNAGWKIAVGIVIEIGCFLTAAVFLYLLGMR